ncbi:MAG: amidohydrolase [Burkholderiales bacterium]|nr:amidohydrolase [Burkholderiales bacterium]
MKKIALEEHFFTRSHLEYLRSHKGYPRLETVKGPDGRALEQLQLMPGSIQVMPQALLERLQDLGAGRLAAMDRGGIELQLLSLAGPGVEEFEVGDGTALARTINDELALAMRAHPDRFMGLATLAYADPKRAADELERCVRELGFKGGKLNSHLAGEYLDHPKYRCLFEAAQSLGVPLMLHPKDPPPAVLTALCDYPGLTQAAWGFAFDAGTHALRLIASGLFDDFPRLKILLGHLGEGLPFWMARIDNHFWRAPGARIRKKIADYVRANFIVTTSGMFGDAQLKCTREILGADHVFFAVDYPYESIEDAVRFIEAAPLSDEDREKICRGNAQRLLALPHRAAVQQEAV